MVKLLPKHNTESLAVEPGTTSLYTVDLDAGAQTAQAVSSVIVIKICSTASIRTSMRREPHLPGGKIYRHFNIEDDKATFLSREVRIGEPALDKGSHWRSDASAHESRRQRVA